jgi:hypothetical protein
MSWLNAHESFFMDLVAEDRVKDLQDSIDDEIPRAEPAARHVRDAAGVLPQHALVKAT